MDATISTPRITGDLIQSFVNRNIILVGKITQLRGDTAVMDADGAQIIINLRRVSSSTRLRRLSTLFGTVEPCG
jgi:hypothetical protein